MAAELLEKDTPADATQSASTASEPTPAKSSDDDLDGAIAEYDAAIPKETDASEDFQKLAEEALAEHRAQQQGPQDNNRLSAMEGENAQLRDHFNLEREKADFGKFTADLQSKVPAHLGEDWAEKELIVAATKNPELAAAWDLRNSDRRAVDLELTKVERALDHLQRNPATADPKKVEALMQYGYRLGLALNSREILRRATADIVSRGNSIREIDWEVTADHYAVAQAVRGASEKASPEPPPNLGRMGNKEFENFVRDNYGF